MNNENYKNHILSDISDQFTKINHQQESSSAERLNQINNEISDLLKEYTKISQQNLDTVNQMMKDYSHFFNLDN